MISKDTAEHYLWGDRCDGWHLVKQPQLSIIQERMPPGCSEVRHFHVFAWQFFFILSGIATLEIAGDRQILCTHEGVEVPPGVPHQMQNDSEEDLEFIVTSQPPSHGDRYIVQG
ncbi:MAG: cupin domain-containing protein [Kastovskya adunca ATA6-11-RM4]|jgi:mannose-6-phosphate isomerase-like protein (cupin superfamily)|nr:cupin domain-containing protein [Kastovskya adunca ATA6-11-RM4]